jgi:hypothetical protein
MSIYKAFGIEPGPDSFLDDGVRTEQSQKEWFEARQKYPDYFTFACVRNPWDRFVSGCKHVYGVSFTSAEDVLMNMPAPYTNPSGLLVENEYLHVAVPQYQYLYHDGKCVVDFLMRFENLQPDFDAVCDKIGKPRMVLPHVNKTEHEHYSTYFKSVKALAIFDALFCIDIDTFRYIFDV